jgi:Arc/MetJ family transcription regulator
MMGRTNVVVDDELIERVMKLYHLRTKREAIDFALRQVARRAERDQKILELRGSGWGGDFEAIRGHPIESE